MNGLSYEEIESIGDRNILLEYKLKVDTDLQLVKIDLQEIKAVCAQRDEFIDAEEFARKQRKAAHLGRLSQKIQMQIGKLIAPSTRINLDAIERHFVDAAKEMLPNNDFRAIMDVAKNRVELNSETQRMLGAINTGAKY